LFVVEDSVNMQIALRELLSPRAGFDVVAAARSEMEATEWLIQNKSAWDVASVDLMLSDGSGFNIIRRCRDHAPSNQVVIFSEYVTDVIRERCMALGASAAFAKSEFNEYAQFMDRLRDSRISS
jgi:DNA-binding NarL/FixJ family response regulator